jgi:hypothetical protein
MEWYEMILRAASDKVYDQRGGRSSLYYYSCHQKKKKDFYD